tara:strand:- start:18908 stop:19810 length:903 start_codon:yes stop_codon:yes gene_type:complete
VPYCLSDSDGLHVRSILSFLGKDVIFPVLAWSDMTKENKVIPIQLDDGKVVEAVFYGSGTLCLSTQVGCVVGCPFCASGAKGFFRHLTFDEMMTQIEVATNLCTPERITLSGIGEPLHNWDVTKQLIEDFALPVSVTTTGSPLKHLRKLLQLPHNGVMLSLHSAIEATHKQLIPRGPSCEGLLQTLKEAWPTLSRNKKRKLGINYLLIDGINDSQQELDAMADVMRSFPEVTLHLLLCNTVEHATFRSPPDERLQEIHQFFRDQDIHCRRANSWRRKEDGGCGTLMVRGLQGISEKTVAS